MYRKITVFIILLCIMISPFSIPAFAYSLNESVADIDSYYLYNFENDLLMAAKNIDQIIPASSTVKMMTACVALESDIPRDRRVTITEEMLSFVSGRNMRLKVGDSLTFNDLLYATVCGSYNDATVALAFTVSDSLTDFVDLMNQKANSLGMISTTYADVTGMSASGNVTSIKDLVLLTRYLIKNDEYLTLTSTRSYSISASAVCDATRITNRSSLLSSYRSLYNFNTGSTETNGDSTVFYYDDGELSFICIVMNAKATDPDDETNHAESYSKKLLYHALNDYSFVTAVKADTVIGTLPVKYSMSGDEVAIYPKGDMTVYISDDVDITDDLTISTYIYGFELKAPLRAGDEVGMMMVSSGGRYLGCIPIIVKENVERNGFLYAMDLVKSYVMSRSFIIAVIVFIILFVVYIVVQKNHLDKMYKKNPNMGILSKFLKKKK